MNTRKRLAAMSRAGASVGVASDAMPNPACVVGARQSCAHPLVDRQLNERLFAYEQQVRGRFTAILATLKALSAFQHEADFVERAQQLAERSLGYLLPDDLLSGAWIAGLDMRALHAYCVFHSVRACVRHAAADQQPWRERLAINAAFLAECGYHTVDISPCADGRLQGLLPFVFRMDSNDSVLVKAYAGTLFDVEDDVADWTQRELLRLAGALPGDRESNYLKIAVYHLSSSNPCSEGCAAHGSNELAAMQAALDRLIELRAAVENTYGQGAAPDVLLVGMDTDTDSIRIHLPDASGEPKLTHFVDTPTVYRDTLSLDPAAARAAINETLARAEQQAQVTMPSGMRRLVLRLLEANLSQIEYVIQHHAGRYATIGHNERFICAGEALSELQLRNKFYFAHLATLEEGVADMDVGVKIFTGLNVRHGLAIPVLVHFHYHSRIPGARGRAVDRCRRVKAAIEERYRSLHERGLLHCQMAVSDHDGTERCTFIDDADVVPEH